MDEKQLSEIKERCEKATPGPWNDDQNPCDDYWAENHPEDFDFVAHSREDVPALVAEVERLQEALKGTTQGNIIRGGLLEILMQAKADGDEHTGNLAARMIDRLDEGKSILDA